MTFRTALRDSAEAGAAIKNACRSSRYFGKSLTFSTFYRVGATLFLNLIEGYRSHVLMHLKSEPEADWLVAALVVSLAERIDMDRRVIRSDALSGDNVTARKTKASRSFVWFVRDGSSVFYGNSKYDGVVADALERLDSYDFYAFVFTKKHGHQYTVCSGAL